jgi:catechol 2,3-dioxygenase-like lactoylglutathione lyase family enzyme
MKDVVKCRKQLLRTVAVFALVLVSIELLSFSLVAQTPQQNPIRPHIWGIAHVAIDVSDLTAARSFYRDTLGFPTPFSVQRTDGSNWIGYIKINDRQYLELFSDSSRRGGSFDHIAFYTDDLAGMRRYLISQSVKIIRDIHQSRTGDAFLSINDPDGRAIEIVEYKTDSWTAQERTKGNNSDHIVHVGLFGGFTNATKKFYEGVLGFQVPSETAQNSALRVPDGTDYIEFLPVSSEANESCEIVLASHKSLCIQP